MRSPLSRLPSLPSLSPFSKLSLRVKLVGSYLLVALGAILILGYIVMLVVQYNYRTAQLNVLRDSANNLAQRFEIFYAQYGSLNGIPFPGFGPPVLLVLSDINGKQPVCAQPQFVVQDACNNPIVKQTLQKTLQGQEVDGYLPIMVRDRDNPAQSGNRSLLYVSVPLSLNNQIIGSMFLAQPERQPEGFPDSVNQATFVAAFIVALIATIFSLFFARSLTRPLESLTRAAEQMKQGEYTQRVAETGSQDELGRLSLAFNEMADTIEADVNELRRQDQVRRDLIANIAHDLATPLTAIQGFSEAMADDLIQDPTERQETAQLIGREVQRMRRLVADMQQMTSLESGHAHLDLAPLDMHALVDETVTVIAPECEQAGITLRNEIAPFAPLVLADSDRVTQILFNLLDNARRHTPSGGSIRISARPAGQQLQISVSDTGTGIDPADLPHIFERFYRADRSRTGTTGGSGLGLSIVKAIITAHGGTTCAESVLGQGTRISFTLPFAK